jgi:alkanesulfonate monooxygenase SsuD/methylene tetrahydromethanopterin reductase-like flavin-dependent oxidoreductase (luciferase family)
VIQQRWREEGPPPVRGKIPILIGGEGEKLTLKLAAQYADIWNSTSSSEEFERKNRVLDEWCQRLGRDPQEIERSVLTRSSAESRLDNYQTAGAAHIILHLMDPFKLEAVERLVRWREQG